MQHRFSDEELSAFLDGEAPADKAARIVRVRKDDPALAADLAALAAAGDRVKAGFDALAVQAPGLPDHLAQGAPAPWRAVALGLVAGVALAGVAVAGWSVMRPLAWERYVAAYQALYVPATVAGPGLSAADARARIAELAPALGLDLSRLPDLPGLDLRRAQMLGHDGQPLLQIAYADAQGRPVALCIIAQVGRAAAPAARTMEGMPAIAWASDTHAFLVIGGDADTLQGAARVTRAALQG